MKIRATLMNANTNSNLKWPKHSWNCEDSIISGIRKDLLTSNKNNVKVWCHRVEQFEI